VCCELWYTAFMNVTLFSAALQRDTPAPPLPPLDSSDGRGALHCRLASDRRAAVYLHLPPSRPLAGAPCAHHPLSWRAMQVFFLFSFVRALPPSIHLFFFFHHPTAGRPPFFWGGKVIRIGQVDERLTSTWPAVSHYHHYHCVTDC
jgi:hypothetical protein